VFASLLFFGAGRLFVRYPAMRLDGKAAREDGINLRNFFLIEPDGAA
jgi:hypothetical protein